MVNLNGLIWDFFHVPGNQMVVEFVHGLVYFLMGFAVLLQSRHRRHASDITLTKSLPWLGVFGVVQALAVWGSTFVPIQQTYLSPGVVRVLYMFQTVLVAAASALLLHFGSSLWAETLGRKGAVSRLLLALAPVSFIVWVAVYVLYMLSMPPANFVDLLGAGNIMARYGMAIPGAVVTCFALVMQGREFRLLRMDHLVTYLKWLTFSFGLYAVSSLVLIPPMSSGFAAHINSAVFLARTGFPVDALAGTAGLLMTVFTVRILEVFDIELGRRIDAARRMKVLLDERDRIARELHDGIIQSLYAVGLSLEAAVYSLNKGDGNAEKIIRGSMERLDETIQDMRSYIMDLKGYAEHADLVELLSALSDQLSEEYGVRVELDYRPHDASHLSVEDKGHLMQIVREAVSNAARHGRAERVQITVEPQQNSLVMTIADNGVGFDAEKILRQHSGSGEQRVHHGLRNMMRRAELLGGYLEVKSEVNKGTRVIVRLPEEVKSHD